MQKMKHFVLHNYDVYYCDNKYDVVFIVEDDNDDQTGTM